MSRIAVVVPTYEEAENLPLLLEALFRVIRDAHLDAEVVVVDDGSRDGTGRILKEQATRGPLRFRVRSGERGLATAVLDGFRMTEAEILVVCDADGSHPVDKIPELVSSISSGKAEMALGSRHVPGGCIVGWPWHRRLASRLASLLARPFTKIRDPLSGFFAVRRQVLERRPLRPLGYKIGLEVLVRGRVERVLEVPIVFRERTLGRSKLGAREVLQYFRHLARLADFRWPRLAEFLRFACVGTIGFCVDLGVFWAGFGLLGLHYQQAQGISFVCAVTNNFLWNKFWTFRGERKGSPQRQYLVFFLVAVLALAARAFLMDLLVEGIGMGVYPAFVLGVLLTVAVNFSGSRWLAFRRTSSAP